MRHRLAGKQPLRGAHFPPVVAQHRQQSRRQGNITIFPVFALADVDHHAAAVDIGDPQVQRLGDAQAGRIDALEQGQLLPVLAGVKELRQFLKRQHHRQTFGFLRAGDSVQQRVPLQRDLEEEPQRTQVDGIGRPRDATLLNQVQQVPAHVLLAQPVRRLAAILGKRLDTGDIQLLRAGGEVSQLHVFDHPLAERRHGP